VEPGGWRMTGMHATMWEIPALSTINELRTRAGLATMSGSSWIFSTLAPRPNCGKIERLRASPGLKLTDFGTRRAP